MPGIKHIIVGTAGHIDHGKTALVKALTGIDADRLAEEKRRGITIDLGFAHMQLTPQLRLGFVDVPGHERFVKNMLAGVGGIDMVLFVVAADESIKPQTREHFEICRLLGIPRGVIALTKSDLVDQDILELVRLEVEELAAGSFLEGAPLVPVSAITGAGLDDLRAALATVAGAVPPRKAEGHFRLPIDRVFSVKGFGTVVTGTLISGSAGAGQEVEVYPARRRLRVRGVQVHGESAAHATAGQRTALNLADIEPHELARGDVLSEPGRFAPVRQVDCRLHLLPSAKPLKHRVPVHFHSGTAEIEANVHLFDRKSMAPGTSACVRLLLRHPALLLPGDRFIIRMFSPVITIGGGTVLDIGERKYGRREEPAARLEALERGDAAGRVAILVAEAQWGIDVAGLVARTGLTETEVADVAQARLPATPRLVPALVPAPRTVLPVAASGQGQSRDRKGAVQPGGGWYVNPERFAAMKAEIAGILRDFHKAQPLLAGMPKADLAASMNPRNPPPFLLDALLGAPEIAVDGETVRMRGHRVVLKDDEEKARGAIERAFEEAGLEAPPVNDVLTRSGVEGARARTLMQILLKERKLVRAGADLVFHHTALDGLRGMLAAHKGERFSVPAFKEWTGVSRKYAIPLLEFLDREHVTRREGDQRVVI